jgi:hypothetical protein
MIALETDPATPLDENAREFLMTFIEHVSAIVGADGNRLAIVARVHVLLLAALAAGDGTAICWRLLHRTMAEIVNNEHDARNAPDAYAYLRAFVRENEDLARD